MTIANLNVTNLPTSTPVFPLSGVLLLPRGQLPLNIFEPRYRNMTQDALSGDGIIGMVQPVSPEEVPMTSEGRIKNLDGERLSLYTAGCAQPAVYRERRSPSRFLIRPSDVIGTSSGETGWTIPIIPSPDSASCVMFRYLGSNIFSGNCPLGSNSTPDSGKTGVEVGKFVTFKLAIVMQRGWKPFFVGLPLYPDEHLLTLRIS